ncbi:MAG: hypothetical protein ACQEUY_13305 [Pseudomonadota bacterium]
MIGLLRSWKLWLALGLAGGVVGAAAWGLHQASTIGELKADMAAKQAVIEGLGYQMDQQQRQHETAIAARDAALATERAYARDAQQRAESLTTEIQKARATDEEIDACLGLRLPDAIADRLRE